MDNVQTLRPFRHAFGSYPHVARAIADLPKGERWIQHLVEDLIPFWENPTALGTPIGAFPTYRHDDGTPVDLASPGLDLKRANPGVVDLQHPLYVRMHGRQIFAYGVAFHLTGNRTYLDYAKAGVDYFRENLMDREHGGAFTYLDRTYKPGPAPEFRRSQDLAYALCGIGFYYYLTRDRAVLADIVAIKDYIFGKYYDKARDIILWVLESGNEDGDEKNQKELVAQLDQIYAYLLLLAPLLPERTMREEWYSDLQRVARIMINQFYSPRTKLFWGSIANVGDQRYGSPHSDFGHSVKTFWLMHQLAKLVDDTSLSQFATRHITDILDEAYLWEDGTWSRGFRVTGDVDPDKEWWIFAELDQATGTLALLDPSYAIYLPRAYSYWFEHMVDHKNHEIWHYVMAGTNLPDPQFPKQHSWKNAFHSFEHALVAYLTTQQILRQEIKLHFAFCSKPDDETIRPYTFQGRITGRPSGESTEYTFKDLR